MDPIQTFTGARTSSHSVRCVSPRTYHQVQPHQYGVSWLGVCSCCARSANAFSPAAPAFLRSFYAASECVARDCEARIWLTEVR